jgi:hypothetical protein
MSDEDGRQVVRRSDISDRLVDETLGRSIKGRCSPVEASLVSTAPPLKDAMKLTHQQREYAASATTHERSQDAVADHPRAELREIQPGCRILVEEYR